MKTLHNEILLFFSLLGEPLAACTFSLPYRSLLFKAKYRIYSNRRRPQMDAALKANIIKRHRIWVRRLNCLLIITNFTKSNIHCPQLAG